MTPELNLDEAGRDTLVELIRAQRTLIAEQAERIAELEERAAKGTPKGMPGLKPASKKPEVAEKRPRKKRSQAYVRHRSTPTEQVTHAVERCPDCDTALKGGSVKRRREVIELPIVPVRVVEHVFIERECPLCRKRLVAKDALTGLVLGKQRLGLNLVSFIVSLREEGRLPYATIQWLLETFYQVHLSVGAIVQTCQRVAKTGETAVNAIRERMAASGVVHADETGWRQNGRNGYIWTFSTTAERYFVRGGRNKEMVDEALGATFSGVLVCDFYAAYDHYPGLIQRCWAHLLRDIHDLTKAHPKDKPLQRWAKAVHQIYTQAQAFTSDNERDRLRKQHYFEQKLLRRSARFIDLDTAPQRTLCARIQRHLNELFVFVAQPEVPSTNNAAERSLRHLVTSRKISGGTRSETGSDTKTKLASLFGSWRAKGLNAFVACRQLLLSPQP